MSEKPETCVRVLDTISIERWPVLCLSEVLNDRDERSGMYIYLLWKPEDQVINFGKTRGRTVIYCNESVLVELRDKSENAHGHRTWRPLLLCEETITAKGP